ncbi:transcriptional regulator, LacI family [Roseicitreum antarcticum]|uniref:Transcriptional regulator, LacI family n=1 Tax=Roseicitreum antarcticum TaxID=564137 RepID=A0A1H2YMQ7_9RHOB|nr:transcriptional regulator, LacI family [Roseicitreum antarcticum]
MTNESPAPKRPRSRRAFQSSVKLEDVARLAEVSTATASRVINSPNAVTEKTRARVEKAIAELGWIPHGAAQALASLRTRTVGALIPTLGHQTIATMLESLQKSLGDAGYTLLLGRPDASRDRTIVQVSKMIQNGVECLVLMGEDHPPELFEMLEQRSIFHVIAYTTGAGERTNCIGIDNYDEMSKMVKYLLDLGHQSFGVIAANFDHNDRIRLRINAIRDTLAREGIAVRPQHFRVVPQWTIACGREGMRAILEQDARPTAVVCTNDYLASGALIEARARGLCVPDDISVSGFDDNELASHIDPPLTTVHVPAARMGKTIADYVISALDGGEAALPIRLDAQLIIRKSTAAPKV